MREFNFTVTDSLGLHARPAGIIVKESGKYSSKINVIHNGKIADAKRIFSVMGLMAQHGDTVTVRIQGEDEEKASERIENVFQTYS